MSSLQQRWRWRRAAHDAVVLALVTTSTLACPPPVAIDAGGARDRSLHDVQLLHDAGVDGSAADTAPADQGLDARAPDVEPRDQQADLAVATDSETADAGAELDAAGDDDGGAIAMQGQILLQAQGRSLQLSVLEPAVVRVHYLSSTPQHQRGWTTTEVVWPTQDLPVDERADRWCVDTGLLRVSVFKSDLGVEIVDDADRLVWRTTAVEPTATPRHLSSQVQTADHFFGFGEKTGPLDKRGHRLEMWTTDPWFPEPSFSPSSDPIYQAHPFYIALRQGRAHGLYLLNTHRSRFDVAATDSASLRIEVDAGDLDLVLFGGPAMADVVRRYTALTGRSPLPPLWALGYHQCRWSYAPEAEVRAVADEFAQRDIPLDGIWLDIDYMDGFRSFTWDPVGFADPAGLVVDLLDLGVKTTVIIDPGIKHQPGGGYAVYDSGLAGGHFVTLPSGEPYIGSVWPGDAVFPDFTRPTTRDWWAGHVQALLATGIRGVWIDMNEPTTWQAGGFPLDTRFDGEGWPTDHREARNVYALLMARATRQGMLQASPQRRPFVLTRSGYAGIQREAAVWTGDAKSEWGHLGMAPAMLGNLGLSGVPLVGSDVGGFSGDPGPELFARWMALGAVSPFFRTHVMTGAPRQEPWSFGVEVEAISRALIRLRYELLPYLNALVHEASASGTPPLRPLVFDFQTDAATPALDDQLMLGPLLLVAPVVSAGTTARDVYLPAGVWVEWDTGCRHPGEAAVHVEAPLHRLPLFARANAALPLWAPQRHVGESPAEPLFIEAFPVPGQPTQRSSIVLDDGDSPAIGQVFRQDLSLSATSTRATLLLEAEQAAYEPAHDHLWLRLRGIAATPSAVHLDGNALEQVADAQVLTSRMGWTFDPRGQVVHVHVARQPAGAVVDVDAQLQAVAKRQVALTLRVALPASTPAGDTVYLASELGSWVSDGTALARDGSWAQATILVDEGDDLLFKFTRGTWDSVETSADCSELTNRSLVVIGDRRAEQLHVTEIARWRGVDCP